MSLLDKVIKHKLSTIKSGEDGTGVYTTVNEHRSDNTLYMKSVLSNKVNGKYITRTVTSYDPTGTTVISTIVYTITYDTMGGVFSEIAL